MKILLVHTGLRTFVEIDLQLLRTAHKVRALHFRRSRPWRILLDFWCAVRGALWADVVLAWFGSYHAFLAFLPALVFRRKRVIIASGYDVANEPLLRYGGLRGGIRRWMGLKAFQWADQVLSVSSFSAQQAVQNAYVSPGKVQVIYHGVDNEFYHPSLPNAERAGVLVVSTINAQTLQIKGLNTFLEVARHLPEVQFTVIGPWEDRVITLLKGQASGNLCFAGAVHGPQLVDAMASARVYTQLSAYESFGMAVAEAMLCGCAPVVSDRGALPEVVGDCGFIVPYGDVAATVQAIRAALEVGEEERKRYRQRIVENFSLESRRAQLLAALEECLRH